MNAPSSAGLVAIPDERDGVVRLHLPEGFRYRSFHDTESPVTLTDGTRLPGRHDGMGAFEGPGKTVILVRNHEVTSGGPGVRPRHAVRREGRRRHDHRPGHQEGRRDPGVHQSQRHGRQLLGRHHALGLVGHLRGDRQRPGRRPRLPEQQEHRAHAASRLRLRGAGQPVPGQWTVHSPADPERRPLRPRGGGLRPAGRPALPDRGRLRLRLRLLPLHAAGRTRWRLVQLRDGGVLEMLAVTGQPNAHLEAQQVGDAVYDVEWVRIDEPWKSCSPTRRASRPRPPTTRP